MDENNEKIISENETAAASEQESDIRDRVNEVLDSLTTGKIELRKPLRARSEDVKELTYDFGKLTGMDYTRAMNADRANRDSMNPSSTQLLHLFAAAAEDRAAGYDAKDIVNQLSIFDAQLAIGIANNFFRFSLSAGATRISKKP